jgi:ABC-type phosphate/phosphonate transport system substrate-binding protein
VRASLSADRWKPFVDALLGMSFDDPEVRTFMEMEGLRKWLPARTTGYAQLEKAVARFNFYGGAADTSAA